MKRKGEWLAMSRFKVTMHVTKKVTLDRIYAKDEQAAGEKAADMAWGWEGSKEVDVVEIVDLEE